MFDLQVNGLSTNEFSCDFWQAPEDEAICALRSQEYREGIERILATVITAPYETILRNLERINDYSQNKQSNYEESMANKQCFIEGVHIEGGLISKFGVHPEAQSKEITLERAKEIIEKFPGLIKLWTLCPKLDTNGDITRFLQDNGVTVAYGHSDCTYDEAMSSFDKYSVNLVTHWGNAMNSMPGFKHRGGGMDSVLALENFNYEEALEPAEIGLAVAAYKNDNVYVTAICGSKDDGDLHLDEHVIKTLANKKRDRFILVSDSVVIDPNKEGLQGGSKTLGTHMLNAFNCGMDVDQVRSATAITPYEVVEIQLPSNIA